MGGYGFLDNSALTYRVWGRVKGVAAQDGIAELIELKRHSLRLYLALSRKIPSEWRCTVRSISDDEYRHLRLLRALAFFESDGAELSSPSCAVITDVLYAIKELYAVEADFEKACGSLHSEVLTSMCSDSRRHRDCLLKMASALIK